MFANMGSNTNGALTDGMNSNEGPAPRDAASDDKERGFPPPDEPIMVFCMHCGKEYLSSEMVSPSGARTPVMMEGFCGAQLRSATRAGSGWTSSRWIREWKDPKGLLHILTDSDDDDEEFEWDDEDDEMTS